MEKIDLIDDDDDTMFDLALRDYFLIAYADQLVGGNLHGYWEMACDYLAGCGIVGVGRMREILTRVDLGLDGQAADEGKNNSNEEDDTMEPVDRFETVNALLKVASDHGLEDERRVICRLASRQLLALGSYGPSLAYAVHSYDSSLVAGIVESILDVYCEHASADGGAGGSGGEAFVRAVEQIPAHVLTQRHAAVGGGMDSDDEHDDEGSAVWTRLSFLNRLKTFLELSSGPDDDTTEDEDQALARQTESARIMIECFAESYIPDGFMAVALVDCLPLLKGKPLQYSSVYSIPNLNTDFSFSR